MRPPSILHQEQREQQHYVLLFSFSQSEIKHLYRIFKTECPTGVLTEERFHNIFSSFFPWAEEPYQSRFMIQNKVCKETKICLFLWKIIPGESLGSFHHKLFSRQINECIQVLTNENLDTGDSTDKITV